MSAASNKMSNRRAQQQRDVAAVYSFCQATESVRVLESTDDSLGLSFTTPNGQVEYVLSFGPDYPDGTVVCSSNIFETVSYPLPVILNNICSELKLQVPTFPLVAEAVSPSYQTQESTSSELTDASDEDDTGYDEDLLHWEEPGINPVLETDIRSVQRVYGENSMDYRVHIDIDEMDVTFYIDLSNFLDEHTVGAWGLKLEESLCIQLHIRSVVKYLDGIEPQVDVFQVPMTKKFETRKIALGSQIRKILQTFVNNQWKKLSNKLVEETVSKCRGSEQSQLTEPNKSAKSVIEKLLSAVQNKTPAFLRQNSLGTQILLTVGEDLDSHKNIPPLNDGFLVQFFTYALNRLKSLNEFCVICDERHVLETGLLKPCVCTRELCVFAFQTLGVMSDAAESLAIDGNVIDLLIAMANAAARSVRAQMILDPYPSIVDPDHPDQLALDPKKPNFHTVRNVLQKVIETRVRLLNGSSQLSNKEMDSESKLAFPLLQWIIATCRAHIIVLPDSRQLKSMRTKYQFLLLSSPPAKDLTFRQERAKFGSTFAFHGSNIENWHSIMRKGLINASGTQLQLHGAAYGSGIYLSPSATVSFGYTGYKNVAQSSDAGANMCLAGKVQLLCLALCEVVISPALKQQGDIWLCSNPDHVCTRFFFVYEATVAKNQPTNFDTRLDVYKAEIDRAIGANSVK